MKRKLCAGVFIMAFLLFSFLLPMDYVNADGIGKMDGSGNFGVGTSENKWSNGDEGVRVTIVRASDGVAASDSIDMTNANPRNIVKHFAITCKSAYRDGASLTPDTGTYDYANPSERLPAVINPSARQENIQQIKRYFTDKQVLCGICTCCNFDFLDQWKL